MLHLGPMNLQPHPCSCLWNNRWQLGWIYTARCNLRGFLIFFYPLKWHKQVSWKKKLAYSEVVRPPSYVGGKKIRYEPDICEYACRLCRQIEYLSTLWVIENRCCRRPAFHKVMLLSPLLLLSSPIECIRNTCTQTAVSHNPTLCNIPGTLQSAVSVWLTLYLVGVPFKSFPGTSKTNKNPIQ